MASSVAAASALSAPPPPPLPALDRPLAAPELADALRAFHSSYYAVHPFHQLMREGALTKRQLQGWVANRLAYQRAVPRKDGAILSNCPDPDVRRQWIQRIVDHDGLEPGTGGIERWIQLGEALGVPRDEMEDERHVLPGVRLAGRIVCHVSARRTGGRGRRQLADRVVRAIPHARAAGRVSEVLPVGRCGGAGVLPLAARPGAARQLAGARDRRRALHHDHHNNGWRSMRSASRSRCCG